MFSRKLEEWADKHHPKWFDILRIILGLILIIKGTSFAFNNQEILTLLENSNIQFLSFMAGNYVIVIHIVGGILIVLGLVTRVAILFQFPILLGAVFFINLPRGFFELNSELGYSIIVLCLLIFFFFYGSGPWSLDYYLATHKDK